MFNIEDRIALMKAIPVQGRCWGIESLSDSLIVGFQSPTPRVEILSEEGDVLNTSNTSGGQLFVWPRYITVDKTTDTILVSDYSMGTVYMLDDGLQLLQDFHLPSGEPLGLAAVGGGQVLVLVADVPTAPLQLLDLTTGRGRKILGRKEGLALSISLVYNEARKQFCVGGSGGEVKVYTVRVKV